MEQRCDDIVRIKPKGPAEKYLSVPLCPWKYSRIRVSAATNRLSYCTSDNNLTLCHVPVLRQWTGKVWLYLLVKQVYIVPVRAELNVTNSFCHISSTKFRLKSFSTFQEEKQLVIVDASSYVFKKSLQTCIVVSCCCGKLTRVLCVNLNLDVGLPSIHPCFKGRT
jgi:hypothetical protein